MNFSLRPLIIVWIVLALVVLALFIWRKMVASKEDDNIHVMSAANTDQTVIASKLEVIDKWGKIATVIALVFGLIVAFIYVYTYFVGRPSVVD